MDSGSGHRTGDDGRDEDKGRRRSCWVRPRMAACRRRAVTAPLPRRTPTRPGAAWWPAWAWSTAPPARAGSSTPPPIFGSSSRRCSELAPDCPLAGIALTHAHMGHYAGLIHLGREAWNAPAAALCLGAHGRLSAENAPWSQLVALGNVELRPLDPEQDRATQPPPGPDAPACAPPRRVRRHPGLCGPRARPGGCSTAPTSTPGMRWDRDLRLFCPGWTSPCWTAPFSARRAARPRPGRDPPSPGHRHRPAAGRRGLRRAPDPPEPQQSAAPCRPRTGLAGCSGGSAWGPWATAGRWLETRGRTSPCLSPERACQFDRTVLYLLHSRWM